MSDLPVYRIRAVQNTQGTDAPGQVAAWLIHYSNATAKYGFPVPPDSKYGASFPTYSRMHKVRGAGSVDEWTYLIEFLVPPDSLWGAGGLGGIIRNWHNVVGDVGGAGIYNGRTDLSPYGDGVSAMHVQYDDNHRVTTTLLAPYSGGTTMQLVSTAGLRANSIGATGLVSVGDANRRDNFTFTGISGTTLTGVVRSNPKGVGAGGTPIFSNVTWPAGTIVDGSEGGLRINFGNYVSNGGFANLPDPIPGQWYSIVMHVIWGRNDNLDPTMPVAMRSARAGQLTVWVNGNDTPVLDLQNASLLQRTDNYYKSPGTVYVQQWVDFFGDGVYVFPIPYKAGTPQASNKTGPWQYDFVPTRFGSGPLLSSVAEALADVPVPSGTVSPGISQTTEPGFYFNNDSDWGIVSGVVHGTQNQHIAGTTPNEGAFTVNLTFNPATGLYSPITLPKRPADAFNLPPSLGGQTQPAPAQNTVTPTLSGTPVVGNTLTCPSGTWTGSPSPTISYQWQFNYDGSGLHWFDLPGETAATLALAAAHAGLLVRCRVTASNASGSQTVSSDVTAVVKQTGGSLLVNGNFAAAGTPGWQPLAAAVLTRQTTPVYGTNTGSLQIATAGSVGFEGAVTPKDQGAFVAAGTARQWIVQLRATASTALRVEIETYDQNGVLNRTTPADVTVDNSGWTQVTLVAPQPSVDGYQLVKVTTGPTAQARTIRVGDASFSDFTAAPAQPVVVNATSNSTVMKNPSGTVSSLTASLGWAVSSQANLVLDVFVAVDDPSRPITSVKLDGTTDFTKISPSGSGILTLWRLKAPAAGTHTIVFSTGDVAKTVHIVAGAIEISGVDQTTPESAVSTLAGGLSGTHPVATVTSAQTELVVGGVAYASNNGEALAPDGGQTDRWNDRKFLSFGVHGAAATKPGDASVSVGWTVTGANDRWTAVAVSHKGIPVGSPPANVTPPAVSGTATQGQTLATTDGAWSNNPTAISYEWQRETAVGSGVYTPIPLATGRTYTPQLLDVGLHVRPRVTAANAAGSASSNATAVGPIVGLPPALVSTPTTYGPISTGSTLGVTDGVWNNDPTSITYQWQADDGAGGAFADVGGATSATYVTVTGDDNKQFRVHVTATNAAGSTVATSTVIGPVGPAFATDTFNRANETPLAAPWAGAWEVGDGNLVLESNRVRIPSGGATGTYQARLSSVSDADAAAEVQVKVLPVTSARGVSVGARIQNPGNNTTAKAYLFVYLLGSGFTFYKLTAGHTYTQLGSFDTSHTLAAGESIRIEVVGTTLTGYYRDTSGVLHQLIQLTDTAVTGAGQVGFEISDSVMRVDNFSGGEFNVAVPASTVIPVVTAGGGYVAGQAVTAGTGSWSGSPSSFAYQWQRAGVDIPGAVNSTYTLSADDVGSAIRVAVIATNRAGDSARAYSTASTAVTPQAPVNVDLPAISGSAVVGQQLVCDTGSWTGNPPPTFAYQWQRSFDSGGSWVDITDATLNTRTVGAQSLDTLIRCRVTASNGASTVAYALPIGPVTGVKVPPAPPPVYTTSFGDELYVSLIPLEEAIG